MSRSLNKIAFRQMQSYERLSNYLKNHASAPLLNEFNGKEFWRQFVDGIFQYEGWKGFEETEKYYLLAMVRAKKYRDQYQGQKISIDFIKKLHEQSMAEVEGTVHATEKKPVGAFREEFNLFDIFWDGNDENVTESGLNETLSAMLENKENYFGLGIAKKYDDNAKVYDYKKYVHYDNKKQSLVIFQISENQKIRKWFKKTLDELFNEFSQALNKNALYDVFLFTGQDPESSKSVQRNLEERIQIEIDNYYQRLSEDDRFYTDKTDVLYCKLYETVKLIQILEKLHPFNDGNCRTFVMQLLPKLLGDLGLGGMCIFDNPNRLDMYSLEESIIEVIQALQNAQDISLNKQNYLLENSDTTKLFEVLSSEEQEYFMGCQKYYFQTLSLANNSSSLFYSHKNENTEKEMPKNEDDGKGINLN